MYLNKKITNEYSIPVLIASRDNLIKKLEQKTRFSDIKLYGTILLILLISTFLFFMNAKRKLYKKRFEALIKKDEETAEEKATTLKIQKEKAREINIPEEVVKKILKGLDDFEKNKGFLETALSINQLAKNLETNPNYLSKTINHFKKLSFSQYMNHLRIDYCVQQLKKNPLYRKFTIKAIAHEFGFNTSESFSKAFYAKNGIKSSFFIKNIEDYKSDS